MLCMYQHSFFFFMVEIILHCMDRPYCFIHSSVGGHWDCFYFLALLNNAAVNLPVRIVMCIYVFISSGRIPRY